MLTPTQIKNVLKDETGINSVVVTGDGYHFEVVVVSDLFDGLSRVARQQFIYDKLNPWILSGELHAISLKTYTQSEWGKQKIG